MLRSIESLYGYTLRATDGDIGQVHDFYFDDQSWLVRYLVADTGNWLVSRRVLISPFALGQPDWGGQVFPVNLTKERVEASPSIDADQPVSRQMEEDLHLHYGWPPYWGAAEGLVAAQMMARAAEQTDEEEGDPHLRSAREVSRYHIQARDGEIGHVEDFIVDDEIWTIRYMVVDTRNWLPGKKVLVAPAWIDKVDWVKESVHVGLLRETIQSSPEYDPSAPVNREYEVQLYDYYGRPKYWL